jgi:hypothetical protein
MVTKCLGPNKEVADFVGSESEKILLQNLLSLKSVLIDLEAG